MCYSNNVTEMVQKESVTNHNVSRGANKNSFTYSQVKQYILSRLREEKKLSMPYTIDSDEIFNYAGDSGSVSANDDD